MADALSVVSRAVAFRTSVRAIDVGEHSGQACALLAEELARVEKACAAVRAMAAARAANCGAHRQAGYGDAEEWVARITGATRQQARSELATGSRLEECPKTREAVAEGELSLAQADEITRTERARPGSEGDLVEMAKSSSRQQLADACRQRRQDGVNRGELAAAQRAKRSFRSWVDGDGMQCGQFRLEPLTGLPLLARIQAEADRLHRRARQGGSTEPWEAHAADTLASFLDSGSGGGPGGRASASAPAPAAAASGGDGSSWGPPGKRAKPRKAEVVLVVDLQSYRTGEHAGTRCHLVGGGPVPVEVVREMAKDAFLKVVFHDGVNIHTVTHLGRYIPAELRTALELGEPPNFAGVACSGCGKKFRLQWDHVEPVCVGGVTSFANEDAKCWDCHARKSDAERAAGLYDRSHGRFPADGGRRPPDPP